MRARIHARDAARERLAHDVRELDHLRAAGQLRISTASGELAVTTIGACGQSPRTVKATLVLITSVPGGGDHGRLSHARVAIGFRPIDLAEHAP